MSFGAIAIISSIIVLAILALNGVFDIDIEFDDDDK